MTAVVVVGLPNQMFGGDCVGAGIVAIRVHWFAGFLAVDLELRCMADRIPCERDGSFRACHRHREDSEAIDCPPPGESSVTA